MCWLCHAPSEADEAAQSTEIAMYSCNRKRLEIEDQIKTRLHSLPDDPGPRNFLNRKHEDICNLLRLCCRKFCFTPTDQTKFSIWLQTVRNRNGRFLDHRAHQFLQNEFHGKNAR